MKKSQQKFIDNSVEAVAENVIQEIRRIESAAIERFLERIGHLDSQRSESVLEAVVAKLFYEHGYSAWDYAEQIIEYHRLAGYEDEALPDIYESLGEQLRDIGVIKEK